MATKKPDLQSHDKSGSTSIQSISAPPTHGEFLCYDIDFQKVYRALKGVAVQWERVGIELGMKTSVDKIIAEQVTRDVDKCLRELISMWLKGTITYEPTWKKLYDAIMQVEGINQAIALDIERMYLKPADSQTVEVASSTSPLQYKEDNTPTLRQLRVLGSVRVLDNVKANWVALADHLEVDSTIVDSLMASHATPEEACRAIFDSWLKGEAREPKTWRTVVEVLNEMGRSELSKQLVRVLSQ